MKENGIILHRELLILDTSSNKKVACIVRRQKRNVNAVQLEIIIQRGVDLFISTYPIHQSRLHFDMFCTHERQKRLLLPQMTSRKFIQ